MTRRFCHPGQDRVSIWRDTLQLIRRHPILGSGLGTFTLVYPSVQTAFLNQFCGSRSLRLPADCHRAGRAWRNSCVWCNFLDFRTDNSVLQAKRRRLRSNNLFCLHGEHHRHLAAQPGRLQSIHSRKCFGLHNHLGTCLVRRFTGNKPRARARIQQDRRGSLIKTEQIRPRPGCAAYLRQHSTWRIASCGTLSLRL